MPSVEVLLTRASINRASYLSLTRSGSLQSSAVGSQYVCLQVVQIPFSCDLLLIVSTSTNVRVNRNVYTSVGSNVKAPSTKL
jgi:hypothetical protein